MPYDVTTITVRAGTPGAALPRLGEWLKANPGKGELLACLSSDIGPLNQIMLISDHGSEADAAADRERILRSDSPFGLADLIAGMSTDTFVQFPFLSPIKAGRYGPVYEVRTYVLKPHGLPPTIERWQKMVPERMKLSPLLAAMYSTTGTVTRFMHIWPYPSFDERARIRAKAVEMGVWPPPGGPDLLETMQNAIFLPASFSPMR